MLVMNVPLILKGYETFWYIAWCLIALPLVFHLFSFKYYHNHMQDWSRERAHARCWNTLKHFAILHCASSLYHCCFISFRSRVALTSETTAEEIREGRQVSEYLKYRLIPHHSIAVIPLVFVLVLPSQARQQMKIIETERIMMNSEDTDEHFIPVSLISSVFVPVLL